MLAQVIDDVVMLANLKKYQSLAFQFIYTSLKNNLVVIYGFAS